MLANYIPIIFISACELYGMLGRGRKERGGGVEVLVNQTRGKDYWNGPCITDCLVAYGARIHNAYSIKSILIIKL